MSPKAPRDISGDDLVKLFSKFGYSITRQKGSHMRLTLMTPQGDCHITIPNHNPLKLGTLNSILSDAAGHLKISKAEILEKL